MFSGVQGGGLLIDCARRAVGFEWDAKVAAEFDRIQSENLLMTARLSGGELVVQARSMDVKTAGGNLMRLEIWFPNDGRRQTLVENVARCTISPSIIVSPDGTKAAIRYSLKDQTKDRILIVDDTGKVLSNFELE